eukprot:8336986-Pyramimonas_sp.AAC.1
MPRRVAERAAQAKREKPDKSQGDQSKKTSKKDSKERTPLQGKLAKIIEECKEKGERRNVYLNLAYTAPIDN